MARARHATRPDKEHRHERLQGPEAQRRPAVGALSAGAVLVGLALGVSDGTYDPFALALMTLAVALVALGFTDPVIRIHARAPWLATAVFAVSLAASFAFDAVVLPGWAADPARLGGFRPILGACAVLIATHAWRGAPGPLARLRWPLVLALWLALAVLVLRASPHPGIDCWVLQQRGSSALAHGWNPYALAYPNPYPPGSPYLVPEALSPDGRAILVYPYPPLVAILEIPAVLVGDVRWVMVVAIAVAASLVRVLGGRTRLAELAASFVLFQPRTLLVAEATWTEPVLLAAVLTLAWSLETARGARAWVLPGLAAGVAVGVKQYGFLLLLPFWGTASREARWRIAGLAAALAVTIYAPFVLWDAAALWRGVVWFQVAQPFRWDALSWSAAIARAGGPTLSPVPALVGGLLLAVWAAARTRAVHVALAMAALAWLVVVLANKQAFCNYYWLAAGLLAAAAAVASRGANIA